MDLEAIWSNLKGIKIVYAFISFLYSEKSIIDPNFRVIKGQSSINSVSASSRFFDLSELPMLYLNPATSYSDPYTDWKSFDELTNWNDNDIITLVFFGDLA